MERSPEPSGEIPAPTFLRYVGPRVLAAAVVLWAEVSGAFLMFFVL